MIWSYLNRIPNCNVGVTRKEIWRICLSTSGSLLETDTNKVYLPKWLIWKTWFIKSVKGRGNKKVRQALTYTENLLENLGVSRDSTGEYMYACREGQRRRRGGEKSNMTSQKDKQIYIQAHKYIIINLFLAQAPKLFTRDYQFEVITLVTLILCRCPIACRKWS